nr:MAG TPA: hypothetical protein [Caudoviricetes sp.]
MLVVVLLIMFSFSDLTQSVLCIFIVYVVILSF